MQTTDVYNQAAEEYYRTHPDKGHFERKPFHSVTETPAILLRLGLILMDLYVGPSHRVVDFGAGPCWLSLMLNKMGISTVSIDVSPTALDIGKRLFSRDPLVRFDAEPQFLVFDGYRIDLPDESVDRVICFDAYHHLPNTSQILGELARILVPGGIAAFAEPGPEHSHSLQSQHEATTYGVLEADVDLDIVWKEALKAGFTEMKILPVIDTCAMALDPATYRRYLSGTDEEFPHDINRRHLRGEQVFFLYKGQFIPDSRGPSVLQSVLSIEGSTVRRARPGEQVIFTITCTNTEQTIWKAGPYPRGGYVRLGAHLARLGSGQSLPLNSVDGVASGQMSGGLSTMLNFDFLRMPLPHDVPPGGAVTLHGSFTAPAQPGRYEVVFDMVDENVNWFAEEGSQPLCLQLDVS
jgi:SAM-dependent methyltransferase